MLRLSFFIIFSILSFTFASHGQQCGNGTYRLEVVQKVPIKYELYSVTPKGMRSYSQEAKDWAEKNLPFLYEDLSLFWRKMHTNTHFVLRDKAKDKKTKKFLKKYKGENFESIVGTNLSEVVKIEGNTFNGFINFRTGETLSQPLLLKFTSKKYGEFYLFGTFFGGCNFSITIDVEKNFFTSP